MSWKSPYAALETTDTSLEVLVREAAAAAPDRPALVHGPSGQVVSYGLLAARIDRLAAALAGRGFGPGDVVAIWAPNVPQWAGVALAAMAAGGGVTGIGPSATEPEAARQLADSAASLLVTTPAQVAGARRAAAGTAVREIVVLGEAAGATPLAALLDGDEPAPDNPADPGATALLPYSSGTTGLPKGVRLTRANVVAAVRQAAAALRTTRQDTVLALPPFCHVMGSVLTLALPLATGATVVTVPRFELPAVLDLVRRHRVTVLVIPPPVALALARHPLVDAYDLSSVELIACGGAALAPDDQRALAARLPRAVVGQGWGLTETTAIGALPDRRTGSRPGSVGRVPAGAQLRVVDLATGRELGAGERGELQLRGPQVMAGYLGGPDATAEMIDPQGWLRTGDLGLVTAAGDVVIVDRLKELIKVSGHQVAPAELEALLGGHPAVADAAVVGRPDQSYGEVPVAVVVPRGPVDPDELMAWVAERVSPYKRLRAVRIAETIPRTPSGKTLRRLLASELAGAARDRA